MSKTSPFQLKFHGTRGSRPVHQSEYFGYGGNTTCLEIETGFDFFLFIDAGTGLQKLTDSRKRSPNRKKIHILVTHTHWDHILFLPFLPQLVDPDFEISIYAPDVGEKTFEEIFKLMCKKSRLPISRQAIKCKFFINRVEPNSTFLIESKIKVSTLQLNHQHITLSYKVSMPHGSVGIITDTAVLRNDNILGQGMAERASAIGYNEFEKEYNSKLINFLRGVDFLVFDTHFNEQNLRIDWGHATPELALDVCSKAGIKKLFLFHHAPEDDDHAVAKKQYQASHNPVALKNDIEVINAREGDEWPLLSA